MEALQQPPKPPRLGMPGAWPRQAPAHLSQTSRLLQPITTAARRNALLRSRGVRQAELQCQMVTTPLSTALRAQSPTARAAAMPTQTAACQRFRHRRTYPGQRLARANRWSAGGGAPGTARGTSACGGN